MIDCEYWRDDKSNKKKSLPLVYSIKVSSQDFRPKARLKAGLLRQDLSTLGARSWYGPFDYYLQGLRCAYQLLA